MATQAYHHVSLCEPKMTIHIVITIQCEPESVTMSAGTDRVGNPLWVCPCQAHGRMPTLTKLLTLAVNLFAIGSGQDCPMVSNNAVFIMRASMIFRPVGKDWLKIVHLDHLANAAFIAGQFAILILRSSHPFNDIIDSSVHFDRQIKTLDLTGKSELVGLQILFHSHSPTS
jgi:hypothetical protein